MEPLKILLVDDHVLFRKGIASLLAGREDMQVVGEAGDGKEAVHKAKETMPDVILMDIHMPRYSGLEAIEPIKRQAPHAHIVILTVSDDDQDLFTAIKFGADGYLLKNLEPQQLYDYLNGLRRGEAALTGATASKILRELRRPAGEEPAELHHELTDREVEILELVVKGLTNKEIADALFISENTVKIHLRNILDKLHLENRIQAAVYAVRVGLVESDEEDLSGDGKDSQR